MISTERVRDWGLLLACNLIWGSVFVVVKVVQRQAGPFFTTFVPMTVATLLLIPIVRRAGTQGPPLRRCDVRDFILVGLLGQVVTQLLGTWGARLSPAANASLITLTLPIATAVMAWFFLGERMSAVRWLSFAFAIAGVLQCSGIRWSALEFGGGSLLAANLMLFTSMNASAFYNVYSKKLLLRYSPLRVLLYSYFVVVAVGLPVALYAEPQSFRNIPHFTPAVWLGLAELAILQYGLSMVLFLSVLSRIDATQAALSNYLIPFFGLLMAAVALGERLTPTMIAGGALVLLSTLLATAYESGTRRKAAAPAVAGAVKSAPPGA